MSSQITTPADTIIKQKTLVVSAGGDGLPDTYCAVMLVRNVEGYLSVGVHEGQLDFYLQPFYASGEFLAAAPTDLVDPVKVFDYEVSLRESIGYKVTHGAPPFTREAASAGPYLHFHFAEGPESYQRVLDSLPRLPTERAFPSAVQDAFTAQDGDGVWPVAETDPLMPTLLRLAGDGLVTFQREAKALEAEEMAELSLHNLAVLVGAYDPKFDLDFAATIGGATPALVL